MKLSQQTHRGVVAGLAALIMTVSLGSRTLAAEPEIRLQHNPFNVPERIVLAAVAPARSSAGAQPLRLQGTLVSGSEPLANIGGTLIAIGQTHEGYRLEAVGERTATLSKDGERLVIQMDAGESDDED